MAIRDLRQENTLLIQQATMALPLIADLEAIRARVLFNLKLGKQAPGYKAAQKALNLFIAELTLPAQPFHDFAKSIQNRTRGKGV